MTYSLYAKSPCVYTVYGRKISLRLVQLNLVSLGTKENYKEGKEIFLVIVLLCFVNCLVASGSKAAGLRQFSKVRSSKRDVVDRCTFHCCCTLLQLCMLQKFEFYPNCRMRKCESVFIKTLRPSWSYSSIGPATFWFVKKIMFTMCTAAVHLGLQFYNWRIEV